MLSTESTENTERKLAVGNSVRQGGLAVLEEVADGGVAFEADGDFVGLAGFGACAGLRQQLGACGPIGLVFGEPRIGGYPLAFGSAFAVMTIAALAACFLLAWRATRTDPARALRD
jgi:hypothetical protein